VEEEVQEQAEQHGLAEDEADEEVIWDMYHYKVNGVGILMADHLRDMVLCLGYDKAHVYTVIYGLTHGSAPLGGCGHPGGVRSIPWSEGDLQAS
jgi:hypothetical protein